MKKNTKKPVKHILEFYYMIPKAADVSILAEMVPSIDKSRIELWLQLNLMEITMDADSLIFQDANDCFTDPLDMIFLEKHQIKTVYQISFDALDIDSVRLVLNELLTHQGGFLCSDSDDFEPIYMLETLDSLC